jgi:hypothetical protein
MPVFVLSLKRLYNKGKGTTVTVDYLKQKLEDGKITQEQYDFIIED